MSASAQPAWAVELLKNVDMKSIAVNMKQFEQDDKWIKENIDKLKKQFPNMFIAVYNKQVVGVGEALQDAQQKAREAGFDPARCVTQIILTEDYIWVL
jgi:inhibitor of KinA sporulation pathway (predicted exonuclease)